MASDCPGRSEGMLENSETRLREVRRRSSCLQKSMTSSELNRYGGFGGCNSTKAETSRNQGPAEDSFVSPPQSPPQSCES